MSAVMNANNCIDSIVTPDIYFFSSRCTFHCPILNSRVRAGQPENDPSTAKGKEKFRYQAAIACSVYDLMDHHYLSGGIASSIHRNQRFRNSRQLLLARHLERGIARRAWAVLSFTIPPDTEYKSELRLPRSISPDHRSSLRQFARRRRRRSRRRFVNSESERSIDRQTCSLGPIRDSAEIISTKCDGASKHKRLRAWELKTLDRRTSGVGGSRAIPNTRVTDSLPSILALVVPRCSTRIRFSNRHLELSHERTTLARRANENGDGRRVLRDSVTRSPLAKSRADVINADFQGGPSPLPPSPLPRLGEIVNADLPGLRGSTRGNCHDNHGCYLPWLTSSQLFVRSDLSEPPRLPRFRSSAKTRAGA